MFYSHLWIGVTVSFLVVMISVTGMMLNHKRTFGFMPETAFKQAEAFAASLPLPTLAQLAEAAVAPEVAATGIDRMDVRPDKGIIKVRFNDAKISEVTLALNDGTLLLAGLRNDSFLEKLHSGDVFGKRGFLLSDVAGGALVLLFLSGFWVWLYPHTKVR
ncbi:putative iron-regulated membrane protein [Congregibacter litoralis KT71]|uniref:Putative iron-regulated membrane protein n=2 Tax=Congregibacter TaxID=393661 RepID=A4ABM6_9GAMM|nr:putative iron-regulated membrane protein [Congregibacter litoralis KT71]